MGLDIFDAFSGIGAGLSTLGAGMDQKRKEELKERLQKEEESRLEQRTIRAEQRQHDEEAKKVKEKVIRPDANGAYKEQKVNVFGDVVGEQDANQLEVDAILRNAKKEDASIDNVIAQTGSYNASAEQNRAETKYLPEKFSLESRYTQSQIDENNAQAAKYSRPDARTADTSLPTLTEAMAKEMKAYQGELSPELFRTAVREALKAARIAHKDARQVLIDMLPQYKKKYEGK